MRGRAKYAEKRHFRALRARFMEKNVRFLSFLTSEMDSVTSNYVKNVVHSFGTFYELNLFDSVIVTV